MAVHGGEELRADAFVPDGAGPFPGFVLVHGGAFTKGVRAAYAPWGRFLAANGYVALSTDYRLARPDRTTFPECVQDVRAAVQHLRAESEALRVDPQRIGIMGGSAGGYLSAMVALTAGDPAFASPEADPHPDQDDSVAVAIPVAGLFDLAAAWRHDRRIRPPDYQPLELLLGGDPAGDPGLYARASALTHVSRAKASRTKWLIAWGTGDEIVPPADHSVALAASLQGAGALVRLAPLVGAPHFWDMESEVDEPGSANAWLGARVLGFLRTWCGW
jgi:acetyl esterase/lipase